METMHSCPTCKGTGKKTIGVLHFSNNNGIQIEGNPMELTCASCMGAGEVTQEKLDQIKFANNLWCECSEEIKRNDFAQYYADGEHEELHKHHWRCTHCKKVVQIG